MNSQAASIRMEAERGSVRGSDYSLQDLRRLELPDETRFRAAIETEQPQSWLYYFPFLFCFAQARDQTLLWEQVNSSICLYFMRTTKNGKQLALFVPPFPFSEEALAAARLRVRNFNRNGSCRVVWAEERYEGVLEKNGFDLSERETEFIYDTLQVSNATGKEFGRLRQHLNRALRLPEIELKPYSSADQEACHEILDTWYEQLTEGKGIEVYGYGYVRACLKYAAAFAGGSLVGEVARVGGKLAGFTFGGPIHSGMGSIFVSISDRAIDGLGYLQRHHFMSHFPQLPLFNDSSDTGREGLAHVKRQFRPVKMNRLSQGLE
jgi:hypothetical protein